MKKVCSLTTIFAVVMVLIFSAPAYAEEEKDARIAELESEVEELQERIMELEEQLAAALAEGSGSSDEVEYNVLLYSDEYVDIELLSVASDNIYFKISNNFDSVINVNCDHLQLDSAEYTYEDTNYSTPSIDVMPNETREYEFCDWDCGNEIDFSISSTECSIFSGLFEIWSESGELIENASISETTIE